MRTQYSCKLTCGKHAAILPFMNIYERCVNITSYVKMSNGVLLQNEAKSGLNLMSVDFLFFISYLSIVLLLSCLVI